MRLNSLIAVKKYLGVKMKTQEEFVIITEQIKKELKSIREQWFFALISESKKVIHEFSGINPILDEDNVIEYILIGYQLCCIMGFTMQGKYISQKQFIEFDNLTIDRICGENNNRCSFYRERYLDCEGNIHKIEATVTEDLIQQISNRYKIDMSKFPSGIKNSISHLGILSQAAIATIFGDERTARALKKRSN